MFYIETPSGKIQNFEDLELEEVYKKFTEGYNSVKNYKSTIINNESLKEKVTALEKGCKNFYIYALIRDFKLQGSVEQVRTKILEKHNSFDFNSNIDLTMQDINNFLQSIKDNDDSGSIESLSSSLVSVLKIVFGVTLAAVVGFGFYKLFFKNWLQKKRA